MSSISSTSSESFDPSSSSITSQEFNPELLKVAVEALASYVNFCSSRESNINSLTHELSTQSSNSDDLTLSGNALAPCHNMVEQARQDTSFLTVSDQSTLNNLKTVLQKAQNPNAVLVGPPRSGKTSLVKALAREIAFDIDCPLQDTAILSISSSDFIESTSPDENIHEIMTYVNMHPSTILFFEDFCGCLDALSTFAPSRLAELQKAIEKGVVRCIGAITPEEHDELQQSPSFRRSFTPLQIASPSARVLRSIVEAKVREVFSKYHKVTYPSEVIEQAVVKAGFFPGETIDRAFELLDSAGSAAKNQKLEAVTLDNLSEVSRFISSSNQSTQQMFI